MRAPEPSRLSNHRVVVKIESAMPVYWRFKVRLIEDAAKLWRRFLLPEGATFEDLHHAIQDACGWENRHLFSFTKPRSGETIAGSPDDAGDGYSHIADPAEVALAAYFSFRPPCKTCLYWYDYCDGWQHDVRLERVVERDDLFERRLVAGVGTFPPEDSGGPDLGYVRSVAALTGDGWGEFGTETDRRAFVEWLGDWRPDRFDLASAQARFDR